MHLECETVRINKQPQLPTNMHANPPVIRRDVDAPQQIGLGQHITVWSSRSALPKCIYTDMTFNRSMSMQTHIHKSTSCKVTPNLLKSVYLSISCVLFRVGPHMSSKAKINIVAFVIGYIIYTVVDL